MIKNIVVGIACIVGFTVFAEPMKMASKAELASAKKAAEGLLTSGVSADQVLEYAEEAKKSAEKYQLYCAAFKLYAKEEKAEEAAKVISTIQTEFIGAPDKDIVSMIEQYAKKLAKDNEELGAALSISKMRASAASQLSKAKKELKKNPNSVEIKYQIAEAYAVLGDWKSALKQFKDAGGSVWQIASEEASGVVSAKTAAFWWDYKPRSKFNAEPAFKAHSAAIYEKLLKDGELSVLEKATAESRIEKAGHLGATKPKSELDKLKKICNTKGLVHCWRFNGDLKDCVGASTATIDGNVKVSDAVVISEPNDESGASICLGKNLIGLETNELTIEIWCKPDNPRPWARIYEIGNDKIRDCIGASFCGWTTDTSCAFITANREGYGYNHHHCKIKFYNQEYHCAHVVKRLSDGTWLFRFYVQDPATGDTIGTNEFSFNKDWSFKSMGATNGYLAAPFGDKNSKDFARASYNEVRIWNRALSEEELTQNAIKFHKAGETMKK